MEYQDKYIAHRKIVKATKLKTKTFQGNDRVEVVLEDDRVEEYPVAVLDRIVSDEPQTDLSILRENWVNPVVEEVISVMTEAELRKRDIIYFLNRLPNILGEAETNAIDIAVGKDVNELSLYEIDNLLKSKEDDKSREDTKKI